jgi:hypothetical protein
MVARIDRPRPTQPMMKPAWASPRCFGVSPDSTFRLPLRERTIPVIAHPIEMIVERPAEMMSSPRATTEKTKPATAGPLSGMGCW